MQNSAYFDFAIVFFISSMVYLIFLCRAAQPSLTHPHCFAVQSIADPTTLLCCSKALLSWGETAVRVFVNSKPKLMTNCKSCWIKQIREKQLRRSQALTRWQVPWWDRLSPTSPGQFEQFESFIYFSPCLHLHTDPNNAILQVVI